MTGTTEAIEFSGLKLMALLRAEERRPALTLSLGLHAPCLGFDVGTPERAECRSQRRGHERFLFVTTDASI